MQAGSLLIIGGIILISFGVLWQFGFRIGQLPGDIVISRDNFRMYFPITTSILISILLTMAVWFYHN